jgi:hypothetical protein
MKRKWMLSVTALLIFVVGCNKSTNQPASTTNPPNANAPSGTTDQTVQNAAPEQTAPAPQTPEPPQPFVVPAGTRVPVILSTTISSYKDSAGDEFEGSLGEPILVDGEVAIPKGAIVRGTVVNAKKQGAIKGEAVLSVRLTSLHVRGKDYLIASSTYGATEKGKGKRSAMMTGGGAGIGALIGGLAGGGKGAAIGAAVGGGGGLAASAGTGGQNVQLPAESRVTFKLTQAVTIDR